jgi:predicted ester cyclase
MTATQSRKRVVEQWFSAFSSGDTSQLADIHDAQCRNHAPGPFDDSVWPTTGNPFGPDDAASTIAWLRQNMPDLDVRIDALLGEGDQVVAWVRATGTPTGPGPIPATGRKVDFAQAHRFRISEQGRIVEHWAVRDDLRSMLQAGAITAPPQAGTPATMGNVG